MSTMLVLGYGGVERGGFMLGPMYASAFQLGKPGRFLRLDSGLTVPAPITSPGTTVFPPIRNPMRPTARHLACLAGLVLVASTACHRRSSEDVAPVSGPRATDGNIVAIILAANNTDLSYARLVPSRARGADVKAFAQRMTTDHTILNVKVSDIALRNDIKAEDDATSLDFRDHSAQRRDILRELDGARFDSTYIANEVQYHTELLAAIETVLTPNARNSELREFVGSLKPAVSAHLAHAQQIRAALVTRK